jgi:hypothetical protein
MMIVILPLALFNVGDSCGKWANAQIKLDQNEGVNAHFYKRLAAIPMILLHI